MYNLDEYKRLTSKYCYYASWAIWNKEKEDDSSIIDQHLDQLHSKFVLVGLNISHSLAGKAWSNFHGGKHDRKLKYACNDTKLRGSYITDIFKDIDEVSSKNLKNILTEKVINKNVSFFNQEMKDIKISGDTQFIVLGTPTSLLAEYFDKYFKQKYKNHIIYHYHHSYYGLTDREWVCGLWKKLSINKNFDMVTKKESAVHKDGMIFFPSKI